MHTSRLSASIFFFLSLFSVFLGFGLVADEAEAACETPNLVIVLDRSCSMGIGAGSKWDSAVKAVNLITNQYKGKLRFGLVTFNDKVFLDYGIHTCVKDGAKCVASLQKKLGNIVVSGGTNLVGALNKASSHLKAVYLGDSVKSRKSSLMFITDGQDACADKEVEKLYKDLLAQQKVEVKTYVIGFGAGVSDKCLNSMAVKGRTALKTGTRKYYKAGSSLDLSNAMKVIADAATKETCNGLDDNCDNIVDNKKRNDKALLSRSCKGPCGNGVELCRSGKWATCSAARQPVAETCNGKDDDCDGKTDESLSRDCSNSCGKGKETCQSGKYVNCNAPKPVSEVCNNKDDDCDGKADEDIKRKCTSACGQGVQSCSKGRWGKCSGSGLKKELCNNKDDDCDGSIDEGLQRKCKGLCGEGTEICQKGKWINCTAPLARKELCNNKDDDCDGKTDEGLRRTCTVTCGRGKQTCAKGRWGKCSAPKPQKEICDGRDNDCNGKIDEMKSTGTCPKCVEGLCYKLCQQECVKGFRCIKGICREDPCRLIRCARTEVCSSGKCIDVCKEVTCKKGQICFEGKCKKKGANCYTNGCKRKEICKSGKCVKDLCLGVSCRGNRLYCRDGKCVETCYNVRCEKGSYCFNGRCEKKPCNGGCSRGKVCFRDKCISKDEHPCDGVTCPKGRYCQSGRCIGDPCSYVVCPERNVCHHGQCYGGATPPPNPNGSEENQEENPASGTEDSGASKEDAGSGGKEEKSDSKKKEQSVGVEKGTVSPDSTGSVGGCSCQAASSQPLFGSFLVFGLFIIGLFRRRCR